MACGPCPASHVLLLCPDPKMQGYSYDQPNHAIYIRNINEKVKRDELIKSLWAVFQQFGEILDICARPKKQTLRGQAWVVFRDIQSATAALRQMQGYMFHNKQLTISYSRQKSDAIAKLDGTYVERKKPREKKKRKAAAQVQLLVVSGGGGAGDCPGPRKETATRRNVTQGGAVRNVPLRCHCFAHVGVLPTGIFAFHSL